MKNSRTRIRALREVRVLAIAVFLVAAAAGLFALEDSSSGISIPFRRSARSTVNVMRKGEGLHFITQNTRFSMHEFITRTGVIQWLVLREDFYEDHIDGQEGSRATITVELTDGRRTRWRFQERVVGGAIKGAVVGYNVYQVTKYGCCDAPSVFVYFSLANGRRLRTAQTPLSHDELDALDESVGKALP